MSKEFMGNDFLLDTPAAKALFYGFAARLPIIDYHCHIPARDIAEDIKYNNITQLWLAADHYKWRAMRACGVDERLITGDADDYEKFCAYCAAVPKLIGNPLYHWSHLELRRYFSCELLIKPENAREIWELTEKALQSGQMSAKSIIKSSNVEALCTTDDPSDDLSYHKALASDADFGVKVYPAFRPDKGMNPEREDFAEYIKKLSDAAGCPVTDLKTLKAAYIKRLDYFMSLGMKTADHGFDDFVVYSPADETEADDILRRALSGKRLTAEDAAKYRTHMMRFFASEYNKRGVVMQIHFGVLRNPNTVMYNKLGTDSGYDTIYGKSCTADLCRLLDSMNTDGALPKTVLYSVNPADDGALDSLCCAFNGGGEVKMQHGCAWWFNDSIPGMKNQLTSLSSMSSFGSFIGMTTDSRSLVSYPRHEYFRRLLCNFLGSLVEEGQYPADYEALGQTVCDVCYNNVKMFFGF